MQDTVKDEDQYILITYNAMEMKVHCNSVLTEVLEYMTVDMVKMLVFLAQVV